MKEDKHYIYDAFISYRHTEPDKKVAEKLHRMLETFRFPKSIARLAGKKKIQRVFRDRDELPTSSDLAGNISRALKESEYLIVICSPRTPQSLWVLKEIEEFKALHGHDKIQALLIEGEPGESFPPLLRFAKRKDSATGEEHTVEMEPLAADIRASSEKEMFKKLKTEILRLLSPMLGCRFDDLKQRHKERLIRTILTASISLSAFFLAFGSFSTYQALLINQKSQEVMKKSEEIQEQIEKTQISQSRYLADISNQLYEEGDRHRAILAALEALPKDLENPERPYVPEAEYALSKALHVYDADDTPDMDIVLDHNKDVILLEMSPDGKTLLTASNDELLSTWDSESGKKLAAINIGNLAAIEYQAFFFDNSRIITTTDETTSCIDINGNSIWQIEEFSYKMALSPDSKVLACDFNDHIEIIDSATGKVITDIPSKGMANFTDNGVYIGCMAFDKTSEVLAVAVSTGTVYILDTSSGELKNTLQAGFGNISSLKYRDDGKLLIASNDFDETNMVFGKGTGSLMVFSPGETAPVLSIDFPSSSIEKAVFHPVNPAWIVLTESEKLQVIDATTGETVYTFAHGDKVTDYKIFDTFIISSSLDGTIRFCMTDSGFENSLFRLSFPNSIARMVHGKGKFAIYYPGSNKVYLLNYLDNKKISKLEGHDDYIGNGCFSSDGKIALSFDLDVSDDSEKGLLCLWDTEKRALLSREILDDKIKEARFIDEDSKISVWLESDRLLILDTNDLSILSDYQCDDYIRFIQYDPELTSVALVTFDRIIVCSLDDLEVINQLEALCDSVAFSSGGQLLLASNEGVKIIDVETGEEKASLDGEGICQGTMSTDGNLFALAYEDKTIKLFKTGTEIDEYLAIKDNVLGTSKLAFSPESDLLLAGFEDNSIAFYDTGTGELMNRQKGDSLTSPLEKVIFSGNGDRFAGMDGSGNTLIFDRSSLKPLSMAQILDIDADFRTILSRYDYNLLLMPVYTTQMLLEEAKVQLNGRTLSDEERKTLFID